MEKILAIQGFPELKKELLMHLIAVKRPTGLRLTQRRSSPKQFDGFNVIDSLCIMDELPEETDRLIT